MSPYRIVPLTVLAAMLTSCATLASIGIQAPRLEMAGDRQSELRLVGPSPDRPLGGASLRLWTRVENPNALGITLSTVAGTLLLEGFEAADADFPLGLPLLAMQDTIVPLDIAISFAALPGLADVLMRAVSTGEVAYSLHGVTRVDAGVLGQPSFGPMTLMEGRVRAFR